MIKNLKLIKYGYQFKLNIICSFIFMLIGIVSIIYIDIYKIPSIYMMSFCSFLFFFQTASTLMSSNIVKSSPNYREFCFRIQRVINVLNFVCPICILVLIRIIQASDTNQFIEDISKELIAAGIEYFIITIYMSFVYKFFVVSILLFCVSTIFTNVIINFISDLYNITLIQGIGVAVILFIMAMVLSEIITRAIYKVQPSRFAQSASLRKYI